MKDALSDFVCSLSILSKAFYFKKIKVNKTSFSNPPIKTNQQKSCYLYSI